MQAQRGRVGNTRSVGLSILWAILTLGIYTFVWTYKTHEEIKRYSGNGVGGVLGLVTDGMDVVDAISATETDANDKPREAVVIERVELADQAAP